MTSTVSRPLLVVTAIILGVVALDPHGDAVLRWVLVGAGLLLLVTGAVVRPRRASAQASPVVTVAESAAAVLDRVCGVDGGPSGDDPGAAPATRLGAVGPPSAGGVRVIVPPVEGPALEGPALEGPALEWPGGAGPVREWQPAAGPAVGGPDVRGATRAAIHLDLGHDEVGRHIRVPAREGIVVTGSGALAAGIHLALVEQLLGCGDPEDELRCVGVVPRGCSAAPADADDTAGPAGDAVEVDDRSPDDDVAAASLVGPDGTVHGAVVRSRDSDRPLAAGTVVSVGRAGCRVRTGAAGAVSFDPALPSRGTEVD